MKEHEAIPILEWCKLLDEGKKIPKKYTDGDNDYIKVTEEERKTYKKFIAMNEKINKESLIS